MQDGIGASVPPGLATMPPGLATMPKLELHCHLDGSFDSATLFSIARRRLRSARIPRSHLLVQTGAFPEPIDGPAGELGLLTHCSSLSL